MRSHGWWLVGAALMTAWNMAASAHAQQFTRVSVAADGAPANGASMAGVFSSNSRWVIFSSAATNLVPSDTNRAADVFVRDLRSNTTTRVSVASDGSDHAGDSGTTPGILHVVGSGLGLSADGSLSVFSSYASLVPTATNTCPTPSGSTPIRCSDIFVHNSRTGVTERVNVASDGTPANHHAGDAQISATGRYVTFTSAASNLVPGDTNGVDDVFLHDRVTRLTIRLSAATDGTELTAPSYAASISGNGRVVAFISEASVVAGPDPLACESLGGMVRCARAFVLDRGTGALTRVPIPATAAPSGATVLGVALTPDARTVAVHLETTKQFPSLIGNQSVLVAYDRVTQQVEVVGTRDGGGGPLITINDSGRYLSVGNGRAGFSGLFSAVAFDRTTKTAVSFPNIVAFDLGPFRFSPDDLLVLFSDAASHVSEDTNNLLDAYLAFADSDGDGIPDAWETQYGLKPEDATDAALDSDSDGTTNLQEYRLGTHPNGTNKRYFAEGAANAFFSTRLALFNPNNQAANVVLAFLASNGQVGTMPVTMAAHTWRSVTLSDESWQQPDADFSTVIESDVPVVIDRTMTWDETGYGSHAETSIAAPGTTWYLAEGATHGAFDLFYLLQNPNDMAATVTVNYLRPVPLAPVVKVYAVAPKSRRTIWVDQEGPELASTDVSAKITSDQPILVERSMYASTPSQAFAAGHEGGAVAAPALSWFLAEGATGSYFDLFVLVANAESMDAQVKVTYLLATGAPIVKTYTIAAHSRVTINVDGEDPALLDTPVSTIVESTNNVPVIVERAMWWPSPNWQEAHLSAGATTAGTTWALAEGEVKTTAASEVETYILIANTSATAGHADVTVYFHDGSSLTTNVPLPANSRTSVPVSVALPAAANKGGFGTLIQSSGPQIVVERAMYSNANGIVWAAGTDALGTKLQ